jgi:YgiT-type zinc finger domain-containing protein
MTCVICKQGKTQRGKTTVMLERQGMTLVFKEVPARVCANCGEAYVEDSLSAGLLKAAEDAARAGVQVDVREFTGVPL